MNHSREILQASLLDRLIDEEPGLSHEPVQYRLLSVSQIKASVIRDLENLLNTRRSAWTLPPAYKEVNDSLFTYGLKDYTSQNPRSPAARNQLRLDIEKTISRFEPRLQNLTVHLETHAPSERNLRFRITAMMVVEPVAEPVTFDTYFDVNRGEYIISK